MVTIKTETLQSMVNKAVRGASNNKLIPLTSFMKLNFTPNVFSILTTDGMNYLEVSADVECADFTAVVSADVFTKLVRRLSGDLVKLDITDKYLVVECNGTYKLELLLDEDGKAVDFHMPVENLAGKEKVGELDRSTITRIIGSLKQSLLMVATQPHYCCYRVGDEVVATDSSIISILNKPVFETAHLVSSECMNLLDAVVGDGASASVYQFDGALVYDTNGAMLYAREPNGIENFNIGAIKGFADAEFASKCTVSTKSFIEALDRIALFVGEYDAGAVTLTFDNDGVTVSSKSTSGVEQVTYDTVSLASEYECILDVTSALSMLKAQSSDVVEFYFGGEQTVKMVDGDLTTILALMF